MKHIKKYIKYVISTIIILTVIILINIKTNDSNKIEKEDIIVENKEETPKETTNAIKEKLKVDIKGEINNPGVYELDSSACVNDVIKISGGLTDKADTTLINLSKRIKDEMVIIIYSKDEIKKIKENEKETVIKYIEKECTCPNDINDACINEKKYNENTNNQKININEASLEEIQNIKGIGETKVILLSLTLPILTQVEQVCLILLLMNLQINLSYHLHLQ